MENASKALIMAGGILIGILIISLGVYLFADFGNTSAEIHKENEQRQLSQFNTQFTVYEGRDNITVYELISVINLAKENNRQYRGTNLYDDENNGYEVLVYVDSNNVTDLDLGTLEDRYIKNGSETLYTCGDTGSGIDYYSGNGRVKVIRFKKTVKH